MSDAGDQQARDLEEAEADFPDAGLPCCLEQSAGQRRPQPGAGKVAGL